MAFLLRMIAPQIKPAWFLIRNLLIEKCSPCSKFSSKSKTSFGEIRIDVIILCQVVSKSKSKSKTSLWKDKNWCFHILPSCESKAHVWSQSHLLLQFPPRSDQLRSIRIIFDQIRSAEANCVEKCFVRPISKSRQHLIQLLCSTVC